MGVFTDIQAALQTKLSNVSGAPSKIVYENDIEYKPVLGTRFWRSTNIRRPSELSNAAAQQKHQGIYQVDVFVPAETGLATLMGDLDAIYAAFNTVNDLTAGSHVISILDVSPGTILNEEAWCHGFLEIEYVCYAY